MYVPVKTNRVARPPFLPNKMSVFNLSPTMMVLSGLKSCLAGGFNKAVYGGRVTAYLALTQSSIVAEGFPIDIGSLPSAYRSGALIEPAPGRRPLASGNVLSSFVARNLQSGFLVRYWKAFEILV
jgi:hypothetical protein